MCSHASQLFKVGYLFPPHAGHKLRSSLWGVLMHTQGWRAWSRDSEGHGILTQNNNVGTWPHARSNALPIAACSEAQLYLSWLLLTPAYNLCSISLPKHHYRYLLSFFSPPGKSLHKLHTVIVYIDPSFHSPFFVTFPGFIACKYSQRTTLYGDRIFRLPTNKDHS